MKNLAKRCHRYLVDRRSSKSADMRGEQAVVQDLRRAVVLSVLDAFSKSSIWRKIEHA